MAKARSYDKLQDRLGYRFTDPDLLERALTHSSAISPSKRIERSYQRLEFLGDRVLGLVVADMLYRRFPKSNEGDLSRSLNTLVRKETCAAIARDLDLGHEMILGDSEARTGGAQKEAILGDITEAVIGKAEARFFSIKNNLPPWQLWEWPANVRWDRMFQSVYQ